MRETVNRETAGAEVERKISIAIVGETHEFSVWLPRYIAEKFSPSEWVEFGIRLRSEKDEILRRMVCTGAYFQRHARAVLYGHVEQAARELIYTEFRKKQETAGHSAWAVPFSLQGELYK